MSDAETEQYNWQRKMIGVMVILLTPLSVQAQIHMLRMSLQTYWSSFQSHCTEQHM